MGVALFSGFGLGFLVAAEVGPIWLLCVRTSVRFGFRPGAAVGAAAATVDTIATASNPLTIASWAAIFSAASVAGLASIPLLVGVATGSATWFVLLAGASAAAGRRASPRALQVVDVVAGIGLACFAGVLGIRALRD